MTISMYQISVPIFVRQLTGLAGCLKKTQALYASRKFDEATLLGYRFFPDMFNFTKQVQISCDHAKGCIAQLAGVEAPQHEDNEKSLADLIARVEKTIAFLNGIKAEQVDGSEDKTIIVKRKDAETKFTGVGLVQNRSMPHFYFHVTTAYNIMRHNGVEIGKKDFLAAS
jgi:uncharacterized protein